MATENKARRPDFEGFIVQKREGKKPFWTRVGAAWNHGKGGGFTTRVVANSLNGEMVWFPAGQTPEGEPLNAEAQHPSEE